MRTIKPLNNNRSISIQFQLEGETYKFSPIKGAKYTDKIALGRATAIATQISLDISLGCFDPSLERYRIHSSGASIVTKPKSVQRGTVSLLSLWDSWVDTLDVAPSTKADHYEMVRRMIVKQGSVKAKDATWLPLFKETLSPSTFNKRLEYLKKCLTWAINEDLVSGKNPYLSIKPMKSVPKADRVKPFSKAEVQTIVEAFRQHYPDYDPFVRFLFFTGVRTGEAIALQWKHVEFEYGQIKICESLSVDKAGNGYHRVRKGTKTGTTRYLPLSESLSGLLSSISPNTPDPEALVFPGPTGQHIDPGRFRQHIWKPLLEKVGIPYRNPYQTRHTLLTHAVMDPAIGVLGAAKLAGHKDSRMVTQHYARFIGQPDLPDLNL
jgi:integrase